MPYSTSAPTIKTTKMLPKMRVNRESRRTLRAGEKLALISKWESRGDKIQTL